MKIELAQVQIMLEWLKTKLYLNEMVSSAKTRTVKRGQVYRCNFGCGIGSEIQKDRPAVIIQNNLGNRTSGNTIVVPITHDSSTLSCMAPITPRYDSNGDIILDGQVNTSNVVCISKARLGDYIITLSKQEMKLVDEAIAKTIGLMKYYSDLSSKLNDKLNYIVKLKSNRNAMQDELKEVRRILGLKKEESLIEEIRKLKDSVDN